MGLSLYVNMMENLPHCRTDWKYCLMIHGSQSCSSGGKKCFLSTKTAGRAKRQERQLEAGLANVLLTAHGASHPKLVHFQ